MDPERGHRIMHLNLETDIQSTLKRAIGILIHRPPVVSKLCNHAPKSKERERKEEEKGWFVLFLCIILMQISL